MTNPGIRGMLIPLSGGGSTIMFQWNPPEIQGPTVRNEWAQIKTAGGAQPFLQFSNGDVRNIAFTLELSGQDKAPGFILNQIENLKKLAEPVATAGTVKKPPVVMFVFGPFPRKKCVVSDISPNFQKIFRNDLDPLFCTVRITLWEKHDE